MAVIALTGPHLLRLSHTILQTSLYLCSGVYWVVALIHIYTLFGIYDRNIASSSRH